MTAKRSVSIRGHQTSISVEDIFWAELRRLAEERGRPLAALIAEIDAEREPEQNLSSAIRVFVLQAALDAASDQKSDSGPTPGRPS